MISKRFSICTGFVLFSTLGLIACGDNSSNATEPNAPFSVNASNSATSSCSANISNSANSSDSEVSSSSEISSSSVESSSSSTVEASSSSALSSSTNTENPIVDSSSSSDHTSETFTEDGTEFVKIGNQTWMSKNMDFNGSIDRGNLHCYMNEQDNCEKYSQMISVELVTETSGWFGCHDGPLLLESPLQGMCPTGSHLPTKADFQALIAYLEANPNEKVKLENQLGGVVLNGFPDDEYYTSDNILSMFNVVDHGAEENFLLIGGETTSIAKVPDSTKFWALHYSVHTGMNIVAVPYYTIGYARCLKDDPIVDTIPEALWVEPGCENETRENWDYLNPDVTYGCIKDKRDGRFYKTVMIGNKVWFAENLRYVSKEDSWCNTQGADNECDIYGRYYSGSAVRNLSGICPEGFHVTGGYEFDELNDIDPLALISDKGWNNLYGNAKIGNNNTGLTFLPAGEREGVHTTGEAIGKTGDFIGMGNIARFWIRNQNGCSEHYYKNVTASRISSMYQNNTFGLPVRCIKN